MSLLLSTKGQVGSTSTFNENLLHVHSGGKTATAQSTKETSKDI
jgi:cell division protein FtsI/penicillin-binding protein 2